MSLWVAFSLGILGSLHCVGMCGPIAMMLPLNAREKSQIFAQSFTYNIGRVFTYGFMGAFMGLMGWGIALAGYQKSISIVLGSLLVIAAVFSISLESRWLKNTLIQSVFQKLKTALAKRLKINSMSNAFQIGLLNGLLPCGLVYVALAGSIAEGTALSGALYMMAFGLGTLPLMLGVMLVKNFNRNRFIRLRKLIPFGLFVFGVLLIYRGIALDVPLDLKFWEANNFPIMCH
ncbi:MAG: sulfite exporter TauE/SafE family protein [Saprospiraceae bacterium]|nr:sulfite exporter TauE/SafE family protein [Saprospiraceae bacterium]